MSQLEIPVTDPKLLITSNQRLHFHAKAKRTNYWRTIGYTAGGQQQPVGRAHITMTFRWPDKRRRDVGNLYPTAKALVDGLVDAGVLVDDDDTHLIGPDMRRDPERGPHAITITIEEIQ